MQMRPATRVTLSSETHSDAELIKLGGAAREIPAVLMEVIDELRRRDRLRHRTICLLFLKYFREARARDIEEEAKALLELIGPDADEEEDDDEDEGGEDDEDGDAVPNSLTLNPGVRAIAPPVADWAALLRRRGRTPEQADKYAGFADESALKAFGYRTGNSAEPRRQRQALLADFLFTALPIQWPKRLEWHDAGTVARLLKMMSHIRYFAMTMGRQDEDKFAQAIQDRHTDAQWLEDTYMPR